MTNKRRERKTGQEREKLRKILTAQSESLRSDTKSGVLSHPDIQCTNKPLSSATHTQLT